MVAASLQVNFEAQSSYKNEEGESAVMEVRCAGVFPQFRKTRHCTMTFENGRCSSGCVGLWDLVSKLKWCAHRSQPQHAESGRWRAHDFSGLLVPVVKAFDPDEVRRTTLVLP